MNKEQLKTKLESISDKLIRLEQPHENRFYLLCEADNAFDVNKFLFEQVPARFVIATGIDSDDCFEIIYHYSYDATGTVINIKTFIRDRQKPQIQSITPFLPGAEWIEREMHDLLGINFINHPRLERLILSDQWPQGVYPMRKEVKK